MKQCISNILQVGFIAAFCFLSTSPAVAQTTKAKSKTPTATNATPVSATVIYCDQISQTKTKELEAFATAEGRSQAHCYDCVVRATREKTCTMLVAQPKSDNAHKAYAAIRPSKTDKASTTMGIKYKVEVLQYPCYAGGVVLTALVLEQGTDVFQAIRDYEGRFTFSWEIDGEQVSNKPRIDCTTGKLAKITVTDLQSRYQMTQELDLPPVHDAVKEKPAVERGATIQAVAVDAVVSEDALVAVDSPNNDAIPAEGRTLIAAYKKTGCFGTCPAFDVEFFSDGLVSWKGIQNVSNIGQRDYKADPTFASRLAQQIALCKFFDLADQYPDELIVDGSATITFVSMEGHKKQITDLGIGTPEALRVFENFLDKTIRNLGMNPDLYTPPIKTKVKGNTDRN